MLPEEKKKKEKESISKEQRINAEIHLILPCEMMQLDTTHQELFPMVADPYSPAPVHVCINSVQQMKSLNDAARQSQQ